MHKSKSASSDRCLPDAQSPEQGKTEDGTGDDQIRGDNLPPDSGYLSPDQSSADLEEVFLFENQSEEGISGQWCEEKEPFVTPEKSTTVGKCDAMTEKSNSSCSLIYRQHKGAPPGSEDFDSSSRISNLSPIRAFQTAYRCGDVCSRLDMSKSSVYLRRKSRSDPNIRVGTCSRPNSVKMPYVDALNSDGLTHSGQSTTFSHDIYFNNVSSHRRRPPTFLRCLSLSLDRPPSASPISDFIGHGAKFSTPKKTSSSYQTSTNEVRQMTFSKMVPKSDHTEVPLSIHSSSQSSSGPMYHETVDVPASLAQSQSAVNFESVLSECLNPETQHMDSVEGSRSVAPGPIVAVVAPFHHCSSVSLVHSSAIPQQLGISSTDAAPLQPSPASQLQHQLAISRALGRRLAAIGDELNAQRVRRWTVTDMAVAVYETIYRLLRWVIS